MIKFIKIFAFSILFVLQCCKENDISNYPISYINLPVSDFSFRAYTKNGEITDSIKFNYLIKKYNCLITEVSNYNSEGKLIISYLSKEKVEIRNFETNKSDTLTVHNKSGLIYWERKDTISSPISFSSEAYYFNKIFKYKPLYYMEFAIPPSSGYSKVAKYKQCFYVKPDGENLILPMINFLYIQDIYAHFYDVELNNEFCEDCLLALGINDTIIINQYNLKLKKQTLSNKTKDNKN
jgi:hypothetical protein